MVSMAEKGEKADVVFMDPPRAGSDEAFLSSVVTLSPKKVVYVSCNPETLARDLRYLTKHGYKAEEAWGYDMFAWSEHVETVVLMSKQRNKDQLPGRDGEIRQLNSLRVYGQSEVRADGLCRN